MSGLLKVQTGAASVGSHVASTLVIPRRLTFRRTSRLPKSERDRTSHVGQRRVDHLVVDDELGNLLRQVRGGVDVQQLVAYNE